MQDQALARRYASALFAEAERIGKLTKVSADLTRVAQTVAGNAQLHSIINQPVLTADSKKAALKTVFGASIDPALSGFLNLLIDKRRIDALAEIETELTRLVREHSAIALATATSAVPLSPAETAALKKSLEARTGSAIELQTVVDPAVLGGVLVRIGDTVYDGTVRGNLERLREQLITAR